MTTVVLIVAAIVCQIAALFLAAVAGIFSLGTTEDDHFGENVSASLLLAAMSLCLMVAV